LSESSSDSLSAVDVLKIDVGSHVPAIRRGTLFRSAWGLDPRLQSAVPGDMVCIDLRSVEEKTPAERRLANGRIMTIPVNQGGVAEMLGPHPGRAEYGAVYRGILDNCRPALKEAIDAIAGSLRQGVFVGCSIGKDRTGVLLALTLSAIGISADEVVCAERGARADIIRYIEAMPDEVVRFGALSREQVLDRLQTAPEALADSLAHCGTSDGSTAAYLAAIGVSRRTLVQIAGLLN
jgi:protein-tyrosine phosphatase